MSSYCSDDTVGPWAEDKLSKLENYLNAYITILKNQSWCENIIYVDAFAAMGRAELRKYNKEKDNELPDLWNYEKQEEETAYINGSPLRALNLKKCFTHYLFIELDANRVKKLQQLKIEYPDKNIEIIQDDCNKAIFDYLSRFNWKKSRGVIFLDPFGMQITWATIEKIAHLSPTNQPLEIILNLPIQTTIERFLPNEFEYNKKNGRLIQSYNDFFGSDEWFNLIYTEKQTLFGTEIVKNIGADDTLALWYAQRLKQLFGDVSIPYKVKNTKNRGLYYLIWAGQNATAKKIANYVMQQGDKLHIRN